MDLRKPSDFQPALSDDRLAVVAAWLMEEWAPGGHPNSPTDGHPKLRHLS